MRPVPPDIEAIGVIPDRKYRDLGEMPPLPACFRYFDPHVPVVDLETANERMGFSLRTESHAEPPFIAAEHLWAV
jgi:hypothetical protein